MRHETGMTVPTRSSTAGARKFAFTERDFERIRALIHARAGIALGSGKQEMAYSRLAHRLRCFGMASFDEYLNQLEAGQRDGEWEEFTNALTTNLTSFFRESHHFPILAEQARAAAQPLKIWCAGASTGEEAYSVAITLCEVFDTLTPPVRILATDIDTKVLSIAAEGMYPLEKVSQIGEKRIRRFFLRGTGKNEGQVRIRPELRSLVTFGRSNLLAPRWPVKDKLDALFCRNVMIYFDKPTQAHIIGRFALLMKPDGLLYAGHSENFLHAADAFTLRGKTVYRLRGSGAEYVPARTA